MPHNRDLTGKIIVSAIEVHKNLGPGLLELTYEECLCHELHLRKIPFERQKFLPLEYKGLKLDYYGYRMDVVVDDKVALELKCVDKIAPVHEAQLLTYLKLTNMKIVLIINFNSGLLRDGIKRMVL